MNKTFNITGICRKELHYMMDTSQKMAAVMALVEQGAYFIINRPRQYGKTTTLDSLTDELNDSSEYIALLMSLQGVDEKWYQSDSAFAVMFMDLLVEVLLIEEPELNEFLEEITASVNDMNSLSKGITKIAHRLNRKMVLLIDEVDASSNYLPFLSFLAMLRTKYLGRFRANHKTFHSIVLAGVHDIKNLKYKKTHIENAQYNSPWNIAADFKVRMSFNSSEIISMLETYSKAENVTMDTKAIAERLYYYTSGYPFLVSKLCKTIAEDMLPKKATKTWTLENIEEAVRTLLKENNANFDGLIKNLENNADLYKLVHQIIIEGTSISSTIQYNPSVHKGVLYGIFKKNGQLKIHNRIYEQLIYDYMASMTLTKMKASYNYAHHFLLDNNALDIKAVLLKFQQFMKEQYSDKNKGFIEHHGRVIFLAFLAPILNGQGYSFKEVQVSLEKRLDVLVTYFQHRYVIELKRWYGQKAHEDGLNQLSDYLDIHGVTDGYLVIFDDRKEKPWMSKMINHQNKNIFAIWV